MIAIISPAKKMNTDTDGVDVKNTPEFLEEATTINDCLNKMSFQELKALWGCNETIAELNYYRLQNKSLLTSLTPAIFAYSGIQYNHIAPNAFTNTQLDYVEKHLRILSGLYGILKPFDGVISHRLEMQAKLKIEDHKNLYEFWGDKIANSIFSQTDTVVNLASKEYARVITMHKPENAVVVDFVFGKIINGKVVERGTLCKMARGEMIRFMVENNIRHVSGLKTFNRLRFEYSTKYSTNSKYVFIQS
ncbi:MAG: peroxide stress protein YaaA [Anaerotignaceae bacterium]